MNSYILNNATTVLLIRSVSMRRCFPLALPRGACMCVDQGVFRSHKRPAPAALPQARRVLRVALNPGVRCIAGRLVSRRARRSSSLADVAVRAEDITYTSFRAPWQTVDYIPAPWILTRTLCDHREMMQRWSFPRSAKQKIPLNLFYII